MRRISLLCAVLLCTLMACYTGGPNEVSYTVSLAHKTEYSFNMNPVTVELVQLNGTTWNIKITNRVLGRICGGGQNPVCPVRVHVSTQDDTRSVMDSWRLVAQVTATGLAEVKPGADLTFKLRYWDMAVGEQGPCTFENNECYLFNEDLTVHLEFTP